MPAVVINADSAQVYRDLRVLSARPSVMEMRGVPHRLFGTWDGADPCSAADWAQRATAEIDTAHVAGRLPILVGGTGLYLQVLLQGIAPVPAIDPELRAAVRAMPAGAAHAALLQEDPPAARRIAPADASRAARALEVIRGTGRSLAEWQARREGGIPARIALSPAILLPDRETLYARCDARFARMLENGAATEVATLLARGVDPALPVMRAIGVREIAGMLAGEYDREAAIALGTQATRRYAKRQYTWLRHQPPSAWSRLDYKTSTSGGIIATMLRGLGLT